MATVRDVAIEFDVPAPWVITAFLHSGGMKTLSSDLTDDEVALIREWAPKWKDGDPPRAGFLAAGGYS